MPRGPRLDAPGVLHHVMARAVDRQLLFRDDHDRDDFVRRVATLVEGGALSVYAWALMSNHFHLLVRTGARSLARSMRSLLTGYAGAFNRRHHRRGHLFQNRYKSIVCEEEPYFLELVRYLHLNPLRVGIVPDLAALERYRYSGHGALLGHQNQPWQDTAAVLTRFASTVRRARQEYQAFVSAGVRQGARPDLQGGGLVRSQGGWEAVQTLRRGREQYVGDERVLGGSAFVTRLQREVETAQPGKSRGRAFTLPEVVERVCRAVGMRLEEVRGGGRRAALCRAREGVAYLWVEWLGHSGPPVAAMLGIRPPAVYPIARRGLQHAARWRRVLVQRPLTIPP